MYVRWCVLRNLLLRRFSGLPGMITVRALHCGDHADLRGKSRSSAVNTVDDGERAIANFVVDTAEVFAENAHAEQQQAANEEHSGTNAEAGHLN